MADSVQEWEAAAPVVRRLVGCEGLGSPTDLGGSDRSHVWRVEVGGTTYVVKLFLGEGYEREVSALEALAGTRCAPEIVGSEDRARLIVMTDLGPGESLADALLGGDEALAVSRLDDWVDAVAAIHAASSNDVVDGFARRLRARDPSLPLHALGDAVDVAVTQYREFLTPLGVDVEPVVDALTDLPGMLSAAQVLSPSDACPDNNIVVSTDQSMRLIDFEGAEVRNPAWDAAYLLAPWPTCWCAWAMPDAVAERALDRYRRAAVPDEAFERDLALADLAWSVLTPGWFLRGAVLHPDVLHPKMPTRAAMILHRLARAAGMDGPEPVVDFAARAHGVLSREWGPVELPLAPVWRSGS